MHARNARREAEARLGDGYRARVLEPSPPAVAEPPWFADDPVARGDEDGRPVVSPVSTGDVLWQDIARSDPRVAEWAAERWLGPYRRLDTPPPDLTTTRVALHRVAQEVLAPARQRAPGGKIGLRWTRGGFGTPFFEADVQLRVFEGHLVQQASDREQTRSIADVDRRAARWLGELYGFATSVLEQLRAEAPDAGRDTRVQLWPEHFDMAVELPEATYGVSPGDPQHDDPYLYVLPASPPQDDSELWNATAFDGAILPLTAILPAVDQRSQALRFLRRRREELA